jgi:hypothetical protein
MLCEIKCWIDKKLIDTNLNNYELRRIEFLKRVNDANQLSKVTDNIDLAFSVSTQLFFFTIYVCGPYNF